MRRVRGARYSLKYCAVMREPLSTPIRVTVAKRTPAERRQRSLRRGIDRWHCDTNATQIVRNVWTVALTFVSDEPLAARGAMRDFWHAYRDFSPSPYFSWLEIQRRGAPHYHALIVNATWRTEGEARRWLTDHWPHSRIQPSVQKRTVHWFKSAGGNYVKKYAKKVQHQVDRSPMHQAQRSKAYQQEYDGVPRELRTFQCSRLVWRTDVIDEHLDRPVYVCTNPMAPWPERMQNIWLYARQKHFTPPGGACTLRQKRSRRVFATPRRLQKGHRGVRPPAGISVQL